MTVAIFLVIFVILCIFCLITLINKLRGNKKLLKDKKIDIILLLLCFTALITSLALFMNMSIYVSNYQYRGGVSLVTGGNFWNLMSWLELPILFTVCAILIVKIIRKPNSI
ncbi:MAG: hypothetical protein FWF57_00130 [Defluviitaleaceae bacterium]|nr:hypothetical protein [Defluviitaleaceae bacterium]